MRDECNLIFLCLEPSPVFLFSSADKRIVILNQENNNNSFNLSLSPNYGSTELAIKQYESLWEQKAQVGCGTVISS